MCRSSCEPTDDRIARRGPDRAGAATSRTGWLYCLRAGRRRWCQGMRHRQPARDHGAEARRPPSAGDRHFGTGVGGLIARGGEIACVPPMTMWPRPMSPSTGRYCGALYEEKGLAFVFCSRCVIAGARAGMYTGLHVSARAHCVCGIHGVCLCVRYAHAAMCIACTCLHTRLHARPRGALPTESRRLRQGRRQTRQGPRIRSVYGTISCAVAS